MISEGRNPNKKKINISNDDTDKKNSQLKMNKYAFFDSQTSQNHNKEENIKDDQIFSDETFGQKSRSENVFESGDNSNNIMSKY
jgi:hypothetical protein